MKKLLIARIKKLKYYNQALDVIQSEVDKIQPYDFKKLERLTKETELVTDLYMCHIYNSLPETLDIIENPKQVITKQDAYQTIIYPRDGVISKSGINFAHIPEERFKIMLEVYKELSQ